MGRPELGQYPDGALRAFPGRPRICHKGMVKALLARLYRSVPLPLARTVVGLLHTRFNVTVAGVFFTPDGRVLLLRHVYRRRYPWGLPAGFLNAGERPEAAMVREVTEEIGLDVTVDNILAVHPIRPRHMEVVVEGAVRELQTLRPNHEIFEGAFFSPNALPAEIMPSHREFVGRAVARRRAQTPSLTAEA